MYWVDLINNKKWQIIFLVIATLLVYYPILENDFLYQWDDQWMVMNQYTEGGWNLSNLERIFTEFHGKQYGPINELLYLGVYSLCGYSPKEFHFACLFIHLLNVLLVYFVLLQLLRDSKRVGNVNIQLISFFTALIFAVHPLNVEAVAWISASKVIVY